MKYVVSVSFLWPLDTLPVFPQCTTGTSGMNSRNSSNNLGYIYPVVIIFVHVMSIVEKSTSRKKSNHSCCCYSFIFTKSNSFSILGTRSTSHLDVESKAVARLNTHNAHRCKNLREYIYYLRFLSPTKCFLILYHKQVSTSHNHFMFTDSECCCWYSADYQKSM